MSWTVEELEELDSITIQNELKDMIRDRDEQWNILKKIFDKYPEFYPPDK